MSAARVGAFGALESGRATEVGRGERRSLGRIALLLFAFALAAATLSWLLWLLH